MQKLIDGMWVGCTKEDLIDGDTYRVSVGGTGWQKQKHGVINKTQVERSWRDGELLRTDKLMVLPDYPLDLTIYRAALRAYPEQLDFPNGTRPTE